MLTDGFYSDYSLSKVSWLALNFFVDALIIDFEPHEYFIRILR